MGSAGCGRQDGHMPLMNLFEPLFLFLALVAVITLLTAATFAARGRWARAGRILRRLGVGAAVYFAVVIAVSILSPRRVYRVGDPQCFDDWCVAVVEAHRAVGAADAPYEVVLRLSNRARGVPMGEKGTVVYLTDARGRRYDPVRDPAAVPLDTRLQPGESVLASRRFDVPRDAQSLGLVYTHEGGFPIGWFVISEGGWFQRPPIVRFD
jgi:hypothetical protein